MPTATPCDLLRSPTPCRVSRFLSHFLADPPVFTKDMAVVTNPTRGALALFAGARSRSPSRLDGRHPAVLDVIASRLAAVVTAPDGLVQRTARLRPRAARSCHRSTRIVATAAAMICVTSAAIGIQMAGS